MALTVTAACGGGGNAKSASSADENQVTVAGEVQLKNISGGRSNLELPGAQDTSLGAPCLANRRSGFADVGEGATVEIADSSGKTLALGKLEAGSLSGSVPEDFVCHFKFSVRVPPEDFYKVSLGRRGTVTIARADAGSVSLTLGG